MLRYLVFYHGAEVVVPEEHAQLPLLHGGRQLTEAVVCELGGRAAQELLRHHAWGVRGGGAVMVNGLRLCRALLTSGHSKLFTILPHIPSLMDTYLGPVHTGKTIFPPPCCPLMHLGNISVETDSL